MKHHGASGSKENILRSGLRVWRGPTTRDAKHALPASKSHFMPCDTYNAMQRAPPLLLCVFAHHAPTRDDLLNYRCLISQRCLLAVIVSFMPLFASNCSSKPLDRALQIHLINTKLTPAKKIQVSHMKSWPQGLSCKFDQAVHIFARQIQLARRSFHTAKSSLLGLKFCLRLVARWSMPTWKEPFTMLIKFHERDRWIVMNYTIHTHTRTCILHMLYIVLYCYIALYGQWLYLPQAKPTPQMPGWWLWIWPSVLTTARLGGAVATWQPLRVPCRSLGTDRNTRNKKKNVRK